MVTEFIDPQKGKMNLLSSPIKLSDTPPDIRTAPANFGEHKEEVLKELGYGAAEVETLKREGVV